MGEPAAPQPLPARPRSLLPLWFSAALAILWLAVRDLDMSLEDLLYGVDDMVEYFGRYGSPDFSRMGHYATLMLQTLATALWGTALALGVAFFVAPLAARNLSPNRVTYRVAREFLNVVRALPDLLLALLFVAALGLGPLPGVLALGVHTAGFLGKFCAESMERVDAGVYQAVEATGATRAQQVIHAAWPSIGREVVGYALVILDRNVRMASVLGLVGAGGIGLALHDTLRLFDYGQSSALIIVMLVTIVGIDALSTWLRGRLH
ncbi:MAG: phosphonate ABC transporter, permease protein PhnE [Betaproteobacteria bacterium]|nr:phosphonate ABC transporter, permease protein PhnE [Betaproteobacteria bacterium]